MDITDLALKRAEESFCKISSICKFQKTKNPNVFCTTLPKHWRSNKSLPTPFVVISLDPILDGTNVMVTAGNDENNTADVKNNIAKFSAQVARFSDLRFVGKSGRGKSFNLTITIYTTPVNQIVTVSNAIKVTVDGPRDSRSALKFFNGSLLGKRLSSSTTNNSKLFPSTSSQFLYNKKNSSSEYFSTNFKEKRLRSTSPNNCSYSPLCSQNYLLNLNESNKKTSNNKNFVTWNNLLVAAKFNRLLPFSSFHQLLNVTAGINSNLIIRNLRSLIELPQSTTNNLSKNTNDEHLIFKDVTNNFLSTVLYNTHLFYQQLNNSKMLNNINKTFLNQDYTTNLKLKNNCDCQNTLSKTINFINSENLILKNSFCSKLKNFSNILNQPKSNITIYKEKKTNTLNEKYNDNKLNLYSYKKQDLLNNFEKKNKSSINQSDIEINFDKFTQVWRPFELNDFSTSIISESK